MHIHNNSANKICSLFLNQGDCNNILDRDVAKFLGIFSWSEIGLSYFVINSLIVSCFPSLYSYSVLLNILVLPYTVWSLWYQAKIAKQWCILCVVVQFLLWILFINNLIFGLIEVPIFSFSKIILCGFLYLIPLLYLNILVPSLTNANKLSQTTQALNFFKSDRNIFNALLKQQPYYKIDKNIGLLWGNIEAQNVLTIITNPHCNPCMKMHKRLKELLWTTEHKYCIQYILTSFDEEREKSNLLFISMYKQKSLNDFLLFLDNWNQGDNNMKKYQKYVSDDKNENYLLEYKKQKEWLERTPLRTTPTILFNGFLLMDKYEVEDLAFLVEKNE